MEFWCFEVPSKSVQQPLCIDLVQLNAIFASWRLWKLRFFLLHGSLLLWLFFLLNDVLFMLDRLLLFALFSSTL